MGITFNLSSINLIEDLGIKKDRFSVYLMC